jgi:Gram-negative bacterial TonB protein C-terminal
MNVVFAFLCSCLLFWTTLTPLAEAPRLLRFQTPAYPPIAWQSNIHGKVSMKILVHKDGRFAFTEEVEGPPTLVGATKQNLCSWVFAAHDSDEPIPLQVEYEYRIDKHRTTDQLTSEVTFELPGHVTIVAPEYSPACLCVKKRSKWRFWGN